MALSTQPYKGARDFYPEDKRLQKYMFGVIRQVVERYGYEEYDAPILEPTELFASKTSDEIVNEQTYTFEDRGGRSVTIRTEMTPSVSRMVAARRQELAYPVRWYSIPSLWRYERPQRGRLREFWQPNVDIFGVDGIEADHEIIQVADQVLQAFGAGRDMYVIKLNSRQLVNVFLQDILGLDETQATAIIRLVDRKEKMEPAAFRDLIDAAFTPSQRDKNTSDQLLSFLETKTVAELSEALRQNPSAQELQEVLSLLEKSGITNVEFDPTLMRGFDYYTDIVFEVFDTNPENNRSMFGGGRYDGLVALFGVEPVSAVGFAMGDVTLQNFLESHHLIPGLKSEVDLRAVLLGDIYQSAQPALQKMRELGINLSVDSSDRKLDRKIKSAAKSGVRYALFIGQQELEAEKYPLKDLVTGQENKYSLPELADIIKDYRKS